MKHIVESHTTLQYLKEWALRPGESLEGNNLCIAGFFFWNSGIDDQRSKAGMFSALLFKVLDEYQDLIPVVFPERWAQYYSEPINHVAPRFDS
jgi:hypothetical protein